MDLIPLQFVITCAHPLHRWKELFLGQTRLTSRIPAANGSVNIETNLSVTLAVSKTQVEFMLAY